MPDQDQMVDLIAKYLKEDQGEPAKAQVVAALAIVAVGQLRTSRGVGLPVSKKTELHQLAAYLVSRYLGGTRPSPGNNYLGQMASFVGSRLAKEHPPVAISKLGLTTLAALTLGHMSDLMPPMARASIAVKITELYIAGL